MNGVDFCFGGSFLGLLATRNIESSNGLTTYRASRIPGTNCVIVVNRKTYEKDLGHSGFRLERLLTGKNIEDTRSTGVVEHVHIMKINDKRVLFIAEVDAFDESNHSLVEIKSSFAPRTERSIAVFFHMLSNGSSILIHTDHTKKIRSMLLSDVADSIRLYADFPRYQENIAKGMSQILEYFRDEEDEEFSISIEPDGIKLHEENDYSIFPPRDVTSQLVTALSQKYQLSHEMNVPMSPSQTSSPRDEDVLFESIAEQAVVQATLARPSSTKDDDNEEINDNTRITESTTQESTTQNTTFDCLITVASLPDVTVMCTNKTKFSVTGYIWKKYFCSSSVSNDGNDELAQSTPKYLPISYSSLQRVVDFCTRNEQNPCKHAF